MPSFDARPRWVERLRRSREPAFLAVTGLALVAGGIAWLAGAREVADACWIAGTAVAIVPATWWVVDALRNGRVGVDVIALLSLIGTLLVEEYLAGALIAIMLATGQALDAAAGRRATKDLRSLLDRAPRTARRRIDDGVETVPLEDITVGEVLVVGAGEVVPVDGWVTSGLAVLDESALTGEPLAVSRRRGEAVRSGIVNAGPVFEMQARATAEESTYAGIVRLAQDAAAESAPVVRVADRIAGWFLPLALAVSGAAWLLSGSATRAVAVLVVATPCPLLLAVPVAIVSGLSRASRLGVVIRNGSALENLGHATSLVMDKTGTLTTGRPTGAEVLTAPDGDPTEVLRLAASADQLSPHVLADAIVQEARIRGLELSLPTEADEEVGTGVTAIVDGRRVTVGTLDLPADAPGWARSAKGRAALDGAAIAWVTVDGVLTGAILLTDPMRRDAFRTIRRLRSAGLNRLVMLTGDRREPAEEIGSALGLDAVYAEQSPADKVAGVRAERERAVTVMVGDGVNDAPALAASTVGVAMGARGSTATSEAADVVLTTDRLDHLADAMAIARRSRRIAVQSAAVGMGLSLVAMGFAAFGLLPPAAGALLQEGIDVAVILNALRALRGKKVHVPVETAAMLHRFSAEHDELRDQLSILRDTAGLLATGDLAATHDALRRVDTFLFDTLLPHEEAEDRELYPALATPLGNSEATATMSRMHTEIDRLARRLRTHLQHADAAGGISADQVDDLLACLYGLHAVLKLHFVQEEENYFTLAPVPDATSNS
ncbi:heavy metal translocating P-type ATPase [Rhodococcus spongiicola]|uniref:Heavy metal translocating P-type ATPase n=1 Tax=Rhodococcus spongiicola TaxID=2487352 RepID=A0A3S3A916_9NOCA|nr:heavy metal translocating P-type ATPase [Rhodococcus spongiicola]RVW02447.1 heavy metal translocating P-type ATPase [Rhodococcus spongiicola]